MPREVVLIKKDVYREHCLKTESIPIFSQDWWLDAVCGSTDNWDVALVKKGESIVATMPYYLKRKFGFTVITQPPLTPTLGPWLRPSTAKYSKALSEQKELMELLIGQLPLYDRFTQHWNSNLTNWLPFYWKGFKQSTRYSYLLADLSNEDNLWNGLQENIRREIRKAENRFKLTVREDCHLDEFLELNKLTFERQKKIFPYPDQFIRKLDLTCSERSCRKTFIATDQNGRNHAGVYIIWDQSTAYYLMGGGDPALRNSGATSLCMWRAIQHSANVTKSFDFEGSMIRPIERFFRGFGAQQTQYFSITKTPSLILRAKEALTLLFSKS